MSLNYRSACDTNSCFLEPVYTGTRTRTRVYAGPAEPVRSVRPWPDQLFGKIINFLFLLRIFHGASEAFY